MPHNDFERFYLQRVAVGEACGCAEAVLRIRDLDPGTPVDARQTRPAFPRNSLHLTARLKRALGVQVSIR